MKTWIACGLIVLFHAGMLLGWEIGVGSRPAQMPDLVPVVVARRDIPAETPLDEPGKWLTTKFYLRECAPKESLSRPGELKCRQLNRTIRMGEPCTLRDIQNFPSGLARLSNPKFRIATVPIRHLDSLTIAMLPGADVDLVSSTSDPETGKHLSRVVAAGAFVWCVDHCRVQAEDDPLPDDVFMVTLSVYPSDLRQIHWARENTVLSLYLWRSGDYDESKLPPPRSVEEDR